MNAKSQDMKKLQISLQPWLDRLDHRWKQLPGDKRRRVVLYSFAGYLILTIAVVLQVITQLGNQRETVPVRHITNPVAKSIEKGNLKIENNERNKK